MRLSVSALVGGCIVIYSLYQWWPTRFLPYFWDSADFVIPAARSLIDTHFWPLLAVGSDFSHPPLLILLLALSWMLFGTQPLISHLLMLPVLPLYMYATYRLGLKISSRPVAIAAAFLLGCIPVVLTEYGFVYLDLPAAMLSTWSLVYWYEAKPKRSILLLSAALLTKVTVFPIYLGYLISQRYKRTKSPTLLLIPVLVLVCWYTYHYAMTGWWFVLPGRDTVLPNTPSLLWQSVRFVVYDLFIHQNRWLFSLPALIILGGTLLNKKSVIPPNHRVLSVVMLASLLAFSVSSEYTGRYGLFLLPLLLLLCLHQLYNYFNRPRWWAVGVVVVSIGLLTATHPKPTNPQDFQFRPPENLGYRDMITLFQAADTYVSNLHPSVVYGSFPEDQQLTDPFLGYVKAPLPFRPCHTYTSQSSGLQLLMRHPYSPEQIVCAQLVASLPTARLLTTFSQHGYWIQIYALE